MSGRGLGGHARERASETSGVASGGSRTERAHVLTKKRPRRPRIFIGGGLVEIAGDTEKERGREDLVRDCKGDRKIMTRYEGVAI